MAGSPSPFSLGYIKRKRAIRNAAKPTAVSVINTRRYINPQVTSPLFTILPAEIRNVIFQFILQGHPDPNRPYSRHSFWYRPGYTHARKIATELLLTCRRVYLEIDLLPLVFNEHIIWGVERSRIPPQTSYYLLDNRLKLSQRDAIQYVHLFTQQFWLEDWKDQWLAYSQSWPDGCPPRLRITIRHTDWWYNLLGENSPMALDPKRKGRARVGEWVGQKEPFEPGSWGQRFMYMKGLREFTLELETVQSKRQELDIIVDMARTWRFTLGDGQVLVQDDESIARDTWTGSKHFKGFNVPDVQPGLQLRQGSIASLSQTGKKRINFESEELAPGDSLDYHVVCLTWRAQDPPEESGTDEETIESMDQIGVSTNNAVMAQHPRVYYNRMNTIPTFYRWIYASKGWA